MNKQKGKKMNLNWQKFPEIDIIVVRERQQNRDKLKLQIFHNGDM